MNPGGVRTDFLFAQSGSEGDGNVTYGEAFAVQPFGNSLVTMTLTGAQLYEMLKQQWCGGPRGARAAPVGERALHVGARASAADDPVGSRARARQPGDRPDDRRRRGGPGAPATG